MDFHGNDFFLRVCPSCSRMWDGRVSASARTDWYVDTDAVGHEMRVDGWRGFRVEVRQHRGCTGRMCDEGLVVSRLDRAAA